MLSFADWLYHIHVKPYDLFANTMCNTSNKTVCDPLVYLQLLQSTENSPMQLFSLLGTYGLAYITAPRSAQSLFVSICALALLVPEVLSNNSVGPNFSVSIRVE